MVKSGLLCIIFRGSASYNSMTFFLLFCYDYFLRYIGIILGTFIPRHIILHFSKRFKIVDEENLTSFMAQCDIDEAS